MGDSAAPKPTAFNEILVVMDDQTWIWGLATGRLTAHGLAHVRVPSNIPIRPSWDRFKNTPRVIVHWEARQRSGGAMIEEILDVQPNFDVGEKIVVLTTNPTHEDVVYFAELGVRRILRVRNRDKELGEAARELDAHVLAPEGHDKVEQAWRRVLYVLDTLPDNVTPEMLARVEDNVRRLKPPEFTARYLDAMAKINMLKEHDDAALKAWYAALDKNPNYYRAYRNLIHFHRKRGRLPEALALMQKMHELNKQSVQRLIEMGEIQMQLHDAVKAEFYFKSALDRDTYASGALNGLAEIRFHQGDLEESRKLLARSHLAYKTAANLNNLGIDLVKRQRFEEALDHYTRAQYVLPQQDKGPLLFYNIGLCYARWSKFEMAREFLRIALIKEPNYKKARKLLTQVDAGLAKHRGPGVFKGPSAA
jgi:tetratricopeptide (TPR) repeat protein